MRKFINLFFGNSKPIKTENIQLEYWKLSDVHEGDFALCSDNSCPCPQVKIPRGLGYIYVVQNPNGTFAANLTCDVGAKLRMLNLEISRSDAQYWWNTGMVPKRVTPLEQ